MTAIVGKLNTFVKKPPNFRKKKPKNDFIKKIMYRQK